MALTIKAKRGTREQINSAASANGLVQGEIYLITDEDRFAIGLSANTYETYAKESEIDNASQKYFETFTTNESQDIFELEKTPSIAWVWVNGLLQDMQAYTINADSIVFSVPPDTGDSVTVLYLTSINLSTPIPTKATGADINTGTDDDKFATAKALADSNYIYATSGTTDPTGGSDGDVYFQYE